MNDTLNSIVCQGNLSKFGNLLPTALDYFQTHKHTHRYSHTLAYRAYMHREVEQHTVRRWLMVPLKRPYQDGPPNRLRTKKQNQRRGHLVPLYHLPLPPFPVLLGNLRSSPDFLHSLYLPLVDVVVGSCCLLSGWLSIYR